MATVGIVGLGIMGTKCYQKLAEHGIAVSGFDLFPAAMERAAKNGLKTYASAAELAAAVDIVIMFIPGPADCHAACFGAGGIAEGAHDGLIVLNMSTVDPDTNVQLAEKFTAMNVVLMDAPILGSPNNVGGWAIPLGGSDGNYDKVKDILVILTGGEQKIFKAGTVGNGNKVKLLNNMLLGAINGCASEIMALAKHINLSQQLLIDAAIAANARTLSSAYKEVAERIIEERYDPPTFSLDLLKKDNKLCLDMANAAGAPLVIGNAIDYVNRMASSQGYGKLDHAVAWKPVYDNWQKK